MDIYIKGKRISLNPKNLLGVGGEAEIFLHNGKAIKIYHPRFRNKKRADKLKAFPKNNPANLIGPIDLASDAKGNIIGFSMEALKDAENFIMLSNRKFRQNFPHDKMVKIFSNALAVLKEIHRSGIVVGDLNDLNILFREEKSLYIDADSMQFGKFPCEVATEQFLDPRLYGINLSLKPVFSKESDFYSFAVMLFKGLLFVGPFGGIHKKYPTMLRRVDGRVTVFDPEVTYPKAALHYSILPDELLHYFRETFERDRREEFPEDLLQNLRFAKCLNCGTVHAKKNCPNCFNYPESAVTEVIEVNNKCVADLAFKTKGRIIFSSQENGEIKYLYEDGGVIRRENKEIVIPGEVDSFTRFSIMGDKTLVARGKKLVVIKRGKIEEEKTIGTLGNLPIFASNGHEYFYLQGGLLMRGDVKLVSRVLENQTWFKVGKKFGFGFYRVGRKNIYFIFPTERQGMNDDLRLPEIEGQIIDADAVFSDSHVLFSISAMESGKVFNSMHLIDARGNLIASLKEEEANSKILSSIRNKVLGGNRVIASTDEGLVLIEADKGILREAKVFTDTEPFSSNALQLHLASSGIYAVSAREIKLLKLK